MKLIAIIVVGFTLGIMIAWDVIAACAGTLNQDSWCDAFRTLNKQSGGLLGLMLIAITVHLLCFQWFPAAWGNQ